jgi:hypothetical protein
MLIFSVTESNATLVTVENCDEFCESFEYTIKSLSRKNPLILIDIPSADTMANKMIRSLPNKRCDKAQDLETAQTHLGRLISAFLEANKTK